MSNNGIHTILRNSALGYLRPDVKEMDVKVSENDKPQLKYRDPMTGVLWSDPECGIAAISSRCEPANWNL